MPKIPPLSLNKLIKIKKDDALFLVEPKDPTITVEHLKREFGFESAYEYCQRHTRAYQHIYKGEKPPPQRAAHGKRMQYSKNI